MIEKIWYANLKTLFEKDKLMKFFPSKTMNINEKLNSIVRLTFYISIFMIIYSQDINYIFICILGLIITFLLSKGIDKFNYLDEFKNFKKKYFFPTSENPFTNILLNNYDKPSQESIFNDNLLNENQKNKINKEIEDNFNKNLFRDIDDVFNRNNSQRQFYTTPITSIPNKQGEFGKWLYDTTSCKENNEECYKNLYNPLNTKYRYFNTKIN